MEQQPSNEPLFELQVDYDSGNMFNETSKWTRFLSVFYFVCIGLSVIVVAFSGTLIVQTFGAVMPGLEAAGGLLIGIMVIVLMIWTFLTILLFRFATQIKQGIYQRDQALFNSGLKNLKNYFLIYGIISLLTLVLNVIGFFGKLM